MAASIKPLPEAVRSSVRSGVFVFDIARVVEELIYNSLDAGATKVSVFIGVGTCYVKVVDDGCGIARDGLVLLGERYATSKLNYLADMDAATGSFGYRGEALGSISDVSLLEIVTKAHGRPNGYRKVLKGCKCLYLGIDDDRQDVGTTVIVRDLFYNQPVRRKHMHSSPKKVLHSVKKCVLYIALVHSNVSFKVVDIDSEEKLLSTQASSSPLPLLESSFGIETSSTLHDLSLSDGMLELSGYMSTPYEAVSVKVLQCVYINARYVCNCPVHKLLNELAIRFKCLDSMKVNSREPNVKRSRSQIYANYVLNLNCPRSCYELSFEPSKTSVEFKDWVPILAFIERVITQFWSEKMAYGNSFRHADDILQKDEMWEDNGKIALPPEDMLAESKISKKVCRIKNLQASNTDPSSPSEMLTPNDRFLLDKRDCRVPFQNLHKNTEEFEKKQTQTRFVHQMEYSYKSWDGSLAKCTSMGNRESDNHLWTLDKNFSSADYDFLGSNRTAAEKSDDHVEDCFVGSTWEEDFLKVDSNLSRGLTRTSLSYNCFEFTNDAEEINKDFRKPLLQRCSIKESLPPDETFFARDENFEFQNGSFRSKRKQRYPDDMINVVGIDGCDQSVDIFPGTIWQDVAVSARPATKLRSNSDSCTDVDFSRDSLKSFSFDNECFVEENDFSPNSATDITNFGSVRQSLNFESHPLTSDPLIGSTSSYVEHFALENAPEWDLGSSKGALCGDFSNIEGSNCILSYDPMLNGLSEENFLSSSCISDGLDFNCYAGPKKDDRKFLHGQISDDILSPRSSDILAEETDWFCLNSSNKDFSENCAVSSHCIPTQSHLAKNKNQSELLRYDDCGQYRYGKRISRRSQSAPPFYRSKKLFTLKDHLTFQAEKQNAETLLQASTCQGTSEAKNLQHSSEACYKYSKPNSGKDSLLDVRPEIKTMPGITPDKKEVQKREKFDESRHSGIYITDSIKEFHPMATEEHRDSGIKWRNSCLQDGNYLHDVQNQCNILDISSGILHLASDSLVPDIDKKCLEDTKVLQQVDKKFIPVVASGTLVIIDQHAADERIRLEELRQKVLSGEVKTITYLDIEQELVLPEIGYQLLQNYAEQIQNWGWICNIHTQGLKSFAKNMNLLQKRPAVVTLLAVPCILGVNFSDVDLLEYLQQLADTDGSSTMPPSVLRVLNSKACRGAIMFGDTLLPSECSLIVEELKQTSLCFQCAHGRPTTIPLVNLEALHRQIPKLVLLNDGSNESWHGLGRHEISFKRAAERLNSARG